MLYKSACFGILFIILGWNHPKPKNKNIIIERLCFVEDGAVRIIRGQDSAFYYNTKSGNIYQVNFTGNKKIKQKKLFTSKGHDIDFLQGMALHNHILFICGNKSIDSALTSGIIMRRDLSNPNGKWTNVMSTEPYAKSNTQFDHGFSCIVVNPTGDSLYINSGSRTDHGEIESHNGLFPNMREVPLTSAIFRIPITSQNLLLKNDSIQLLPYIYANGIRNSFDLAFTHDGKLFGTENSGDRDDPEELNWIRQSRHYGFPWIMGGNKNPTQDKNYSFKNDELLNKNFSSVKKGLFNKDSLFPLAPKNIAFIDAVINVGPDADKYRNSVTGKINDASTLSENMSTFTPHRSPLGLTFWDKKPKNSDYDYTGFVLSWTQSEDSKKGNPTGVFGEQSMDVLLLKLKYDSTIDNFKVKTESIIKGFNHPIDALLDGNTLYVIEHSFEGNKGGLWKVSLPNELLD